ncbi:MAG TPA: glycosyltransferase family A protein [Patescibacteria group bacterium]|nr:glycosyltransferase family A protein [Patescibacteria group bacterium]
MAENKLVSVIIAVYNCQRYLAEAIESVLAQTYAPLELIVVDDGSTDESARVAKGFSGRLRYVYQPHGGLSVAVNYGMQLAQGELFAFLDADDLWLENKLSTQVAFLDGHQQFDMIFTHVKQFYSPELEQDIKTKYTFTEIMPGYSTCSLLIKRESFFRVGTFDVSCRLGQFIDWYMKAQEAGLKSALLPDVLVKRRIHDANTGIIKRHDRSEYVRFIKASLDRKRKKGIL